MALPKTLEPSLTPDELTFLAEDEMIQIVPLFSMSRIRLLSVRFHPDHGAADHRGYTARSTHLSLLPSRYGLD